MADQKPLIIKKYANRRLYNTGTSTYVTLENLAKLVKENVEFTVVDAKTSEDITRSVLTQIIVEMEGKGNPMLPLSFLRQLIGYYGDNMGAIVPRYLESAMTSFADNQELWQQYMQQMFPFAGLDQLKRQNQALFNQALGWMTPNQSGAAATPPQAPTAPASASSPDITNLQDQLRDLQKQLDTLKKDS